MNAIRHIVLDIGKAPIRHDPEPHSAGWHAVPFTDAAALERDLARLGCQPQPPARSMPRRTMRRSSSIGISPPWRS